MSGARPTRPIGADDWARSRRGAEETLADARSDKFEWLARCRFGGEGCDLPSTKKSGKEEKNGDAKTLNVFKGLLLQVDTRQTGEAVRLPSPQKREKKSPPRLKTADSDVALERMNEDADEEEEFEGEENSRSPLIKRVDNPMGVSFRIEPLALLDQLRGHGPGDDASSVEMWRRRALDAESALREESKDCENCHSERSKLQQSLQSHKDLLAKERTFTMQLEKELQELKAAMDKRIKSLNDKAEEERSKAKRALDAAIDAANRSSKQNSLDEQRKRDQLDDLNAKLKKEILELQKENARSQDRILKLESELKSGFDMKSEITLSIDTHESLGLLEDAKHKLEMDNAGMKTSLEEQSKELERLRAELAAVQDQLKKTTKERDADRKALQDASKRYESKLAHLTKELDKSKHSVVSLEQKLKEIRQKHSEELNILNSKLVHVEKSKKTDIKKWSTDNSSLRSEIARLTRLLSKAEAREEHALARKNLIEEELQVSQAKIRDLKTSDRHNLRYDAVTAAPDVEQTLLERRTGTSFAHFISRMQNFALRTRLLENADTIEKLRTSEVELRVQLQAQEDARKMDNASNSDVIDGLRNDLATMTATATKLEADYKSSMDKHNAYTMKAEGKIASLQQQVKDAEGLIENMKKSSADAFSALHSSIEAQSVAGSQEFSDLESMLKTKDAEMLALTLKYEESNADIKRRDGKIEDLGEKLAAMERELNLKTAELSDRRAALATAKWRASIRATSLKNAYDALVLKLDNARQELQSVNELREKEKKRIRTLEDGGIERGLAQADGGTTSSSQRDKLYELEKQCRDLRSKNDEDVAKYRRLLREKEKELAHVQQSEGIKLREAFSIISTQSADLDRLESKNKSLSTALAESSKAVAEVEKHKITVEASLREVSTRCRSVEEAHVKLQQSATMPVAKTVQGDDTKHLQARVTELELLLDATNIESNARVSSLQIDGAAEIGSLRQQIDTLQADLQKMTSMRDSAKAELQSLQDELSVLMHQQQTNAEFTLSQLAQTQRANDTLRDSLKSANKGHESIQRRSVALQAKAEEVNSKLTERNTELQMIIDELLKKNALDISTRDGRIEQLEAALKELDSSRSAMTESQVRQLESEIARLKARLSQDEKTHAETVAAAKTTRATLRWAALYSKKTHADRRNRLFTVARDFGRSLRIEYDSHVKNANDVVKSVHGSRGELEESLSQLTSRLSEAKSQRATERWVRLIRSMHARNRHGRFFTQAQDFVGSLKLEIREAEAGKFRNAIALSARDNRIKALEEMVNEYQSSLHETKTKYSHALESENEQLRQDFASARHDKVLAHWVVLAKSLRVKQRRERLLNVAKDFAGSLKTELRLHGEVSTRTLHSLQDTIAKLKDDLNASAAAHKLSEEEVAKLRKQLADLDKMKKDLDASRGSKKTVEDELQALKRQLLEVQQTQDASVDELNKALANAASEAKSQRATERWVRLIRSMHARNRHGRFFTQAQDFVGSLKLEIREAEAGKFRNAIALSARDNRIKALEEMVNEYQSSLHETKTKYSHALESENEQLRQDFASARHDKVLAHWVVLAKSLRVKQRRERLLNVAKDFAGSLKTELRLHGEVSTRTLHSLQDTIAKLKDDKKSVQDELNALKKGRDDALRKVKQELDNECKQAAKKASELQKTIDSLNDELSTLRQKVETDATKSSSLKKSAEARIAELESIIAGMEEGMRELEKSAEETRLRLEESEKKLTAERATLRRQLEEITKSHEALKESSVAARAHINWRWIVNKLRQRERHERTVDQAKAFSRALYADYQFHVAFSNKTTGSLNDTLKTWQTRYDEACARESALRDEMLGLSKDAAAKDASRLETIESLEQKVALVDQQRKTLQEQLNSHDREAKKRYDDASRAAKKEADALRERIRDLEKKLANEESSAARNVDKLNGQIEKLKSQLDKSKLNEQRKQRIVELEAQVQNLESAVAELEKALTAARHTHKDDSDAKNERIKELEHECGRLQTSLREYESTLESTRTASSGQTQRLHAEVRILREQLDELAAAHDKTLASRKSERALLRWAWMCRVLRSKNMHVRHLHLMKSFTSAELVESRNWAKTCDKTIHSLNDQLQDAKTKLKDLDAMHEKARDQDARIAELELMLQEQQSLSETTQSASSGEIDRLRERNAALVEELDKLRADALSDKAAAEAKIIELKAQYEKQLDELRQKIREDSENAAEQERLAKVEHQSQLDDMAARLAEKSKMNSTFAEARYQQMKDDYERQLDDMRKRMQTDTGSFDERMSQAQKDFEHQLADLKDVQKKELAVLKFRHGSALGLRDKRIHELENLLVEAQNEWEQLRSSTSSDGVKLKRELAEARVRIGELEAAQDHDDSDARISALQISIQELRDTVVKLETEKIGLADENDKLRAEIESLKVASSRSDALQSRIGASDQALSDATARAKSERALLRWAWMCRVLRSKNMHVRHLHLVKSFTSAELVESRNLAKTCDKTIHSLNDQLQDAKTKLKDLDAMHEKARDQDARIAELELMLQEQQSLSETTQSASSGEIDRLRERNAALVEELDKLRADALSDKAAAEAKIIELKAQYEKQLDELRVAMQSSLDAVTEREAEAQANFKSQLEHWTSRLKDQSKLDDDDALARIKADYEEQLSALRARLEKDSEDAAEREKQAQENFKRLLGELDKRNKAKAKADLDAAEERLQQMQAEFETQMADLSQMQKKELAVLKFRHAGALSLRDSRVEELEKLLLENETALEKSQSANTDDALASRRELSQLRAEYDEFKARTAIESEDSSRLVRRLESEVESLRKQLASVEKAGDDTVMEMASQRASMKWESFCRGVLLRQHHRRFTTIAFGHAKAQLRDMLSIKEDAQKEARALQSQLDDALTRLEKMRETTNQLIASQKEANAKEVEAAQSKLKAAEAELDRLRKDNDAGTKALDVAQSKLKAAEAELGRLRGDNDAGTKALDVAAEAELDRLRKDNDAGTKALDVAQSKLKAAEAELDRLRKDNDAGTKALDVAQSKLKAAEAELDRLRKDNDAGTKALDVAQSKLKAAESELGRLRGDLDISRSQGTADASALASAKSQRTQASWYRLCFAMRSRQHHLRTMETAKSFASSLKLELKMHGQTATAAIHRLQEEIAALKLQPAAQSPTEDQNTNEELASLRASALVYSEERAKYEEKISVLQGKLADLKAQLSAVPGLKSTMADLERDCKELRSENKRLSDELRALQSKLEDSERVRSRPTTEANSELVKSLKLRVTQLEQEVATMERKHAATTSHIIEDHKQEIAKLQKERDSAARDYSRIIEDLEGDLAEMTASRDVAIADMMKLRLRLDDLERSTISPTGTSDDVEQSMKELHVLRTKVEHLETELATERAKRQREAQSLSDKLAARDRDLSAANNALASSSDDAERTIKELNDKIRSQTTLVQRLEVQITELRVECDSMKIQLGHETDEASSRSAELVRSSRQFSDENAKLSAELQEALAELERLRVAKDFITKEFNFFQIESTQNAELIQRKLERTQEQLNDAEVEVAKLRAQVQEYAAEQEELMLEGQRIQRASDAKITKLRSQLTSVRVEYEEDLRTQVATLQEQMDDLTEELNDERAKSARALAQAKSESVDQGTVSVQRITVLETELTTAHEDIKALEEEIKANQEAVEYAENWAKMSDKRAQGAEEFLITLKAEITELKKALAVAKKSADSGDLSEELEKLLNECQETCKMQQEEIITLKNERDMRLAVPKAPEPTHTIGMTTVNFDLGEDPKFEMPEMPAPRAPSPKPVAPAPKPVAPAPIVQEQYEDIVEYRTERRTAVETYIDEEEEEPEPEYDPDYEYGTIEETEEILEIVEYDSDGNEIIVESRVLEPGEEINDDVLATPRAPPAAPTSRRSRFGSAIDNILDDE